MTRRGTTNRNDRSSSYARRARRRHLVQTFGWPEVGIVLCFRCQVPLLQDEDPEAPGQSVTADRIVPGIEGGRYVWGNTRPCCRMCNEEMGGELGAKRRLSS